jgi:hypothetical protein
MRNKLGFKLSGNARRLVGAARIKNDDFIGQIAAAFKAAGQRLLLIQGNDAERNLHLV